MSNGSERKRHEELLREAQKYLPPTEEAQTQTEKSYAEESPSQQTEYQEVNDPDELQPNDNTSQIDSSVFYRYSHFSLKDCCTQPKPIKWLIKDYIPEQATCMIFGPSGSGKSFIGIDIACHIACEQLHEWHGKKLKHGSVIYFAGEGSIGVRQRIALWVHKHGVSYDDIPLEVIDESFNLDDTKNSQYSIENTIANIKALHDKPALVIFDTLNRYMGGDENKAVDVNKMLLRASEISKACKCAVCFVHHTGNSEEAKNRVRGSSAWKGAMDVELKVTKSEKIITLEQTKEKDAETQPNMMFTLESDIIPNWYDEDNEPVRTCTIKLYESQVMKALSEPAIKFSQYERTAIKTFIEAIKRDGIRIRDDETQHEFAAVELGHWRKVSYELSLKDKDNTKLKEFNTGREKLCDDEKKILIKKVREGVEYYCFDLTDTPNADLTMKATISLALNEREKAQAAAIQQQQANAQISLPIAPQTEPPQPDQSAELEHERQ